MTNQILITPLPAGMVNPHSDTLRARLKELFPGADRLRWGRHLADATFPQTVVIDSLGAEFTQQEEDDLRAVFAAHLGSSMGTDKPSINADDTDTATITMSHASIQVDETIEYQIYLGSQLEIAGTATATAGACQITFKTGVAGVYTIVMRRQNQNESGLIEVEASHA
jgi:hypothetical protein